MATSLQTENYGFGKYAPDDVTSYLTDYNGTMDKIDGAIKGVSDVANEAKATGDSNHNNIASLSEGLTATNKNVENLGKTQTAQQTEIDKLANDVDILKEVKIGNMIYGDEVNGLVLHSTDQMFTFAARQVGDRINGYLTGIIDAGTYTSNIRRTMHSMNSGEGTINNYLFAFFSIEGNPFNINGVTAYPCITLKFRAHDVDDVNAETSRGCYWYDSSENKTYFGYFEETNSLAITENTRRVFLLN